MQVLVGSTGSKKLIARLRELGWGRMFTDRVRPLYPEEPWGLDNGAYAAWANDTEWDGCAYQDRLYHLECEIMNDEKHPPMMVVLPDIVAGGIESLERSRAWIRKMPEGWPLYLPVQDGIEPNDIDTAIIEHITGIFLGGSDCYKLTAGEWCEWSHERNLQFHYARAGTLNKIAHARRCRVDSIDSTFPLWTVRRFERFVQAVHGSLPQMEMTFLSGRSAEEE